jgi:uncharacterized protein YoaH (UPF0181 family)
MTKYQNIPDELKSISSWVCFDLLDGRKIPYTPGTSNEAASNRSRDWRSFRAACLDVEAGHRQHIGFCFSSEDPYTFVDLVDITDPEQQEVLERIQSYAQRSISGKGVHIIARGSFKGTGKHPKKPHAGIFKECRFCLMTGNVLPNRNEILDVPDCDLQSIHTWVGGDRSGFSVSTASLVEYKPDIPDLTVYQMGCDRFTKFKDLCNGNWEHYTEYNGDHSIADHAFLAMLCDLTESNEQVRWLFKVSGMWGDERASKKAGHGENGYVDRTIAKIRDKQAKDREKDKRVTLQLKREEAHIPDVVVPKTPLPEPEKGKVDLIESLPEGLLKDIARYSYRTSFYPLQEASLSVALMYLSGLCGRGYQTPTKAGLNLWLILVGGTSCGKDEYQQGLKRITAGLKKRVPSIGQIFGGELVSGPAIETTFTDTLRFVSYVPEFGDTFRLLAAPFKSEHVTTLHRGLLNSYNSAGSGGTLERRRKADKAEGNTSIERPCLCIAGEATPESLYEQMTTRELATGFLQRFMILDVPNDSWSLQENKNYGALPPTWLLEKLEALAVHMNSLDVNGGVIEVKTTVEAGKMLRDYRSARRLEVNKCADGLAKKEVINRAGLKVVRLASLLALSADPHTPIIKREHAVWSISFVEALDQRMLARFSSGEVGSGQVKQEAEILKAFESVYVMTKKARIALGMSASAAAIKGLCPHVILKKMVVNSSSFASDRLGAVTAFDKCIDNMSKSGVISKIARDKASEDFDTHKGELLFWSKE